MKRLFLFFSLFIFNCNYLERNNDINNYGNYLLNINDNDIQNINNDLMKDFNNLNNENSENEIEKVEFSLKNLSKKGKFTLGLFGMLLATGSYILYKNCIKYPLDLFYYTYKFKNNDSKLINIKTMKQKLDQEFVNAGFIKSDSENLDLAYECAKKNFYDNRIFSFEMPIPNIYMAYLSGLFNISGIVLMLSKYGDKLLKKAELKSKKVNIESKENKK